MDHSYEEIRATALDVLAGREKTDLPPTQYPFLAMAVAEAFARREHAEESAHRPHLSQADEHLFLEVFWDLFRQNIITLGSDPANPVFPFFRLSRFGKRILENQDTYFFHDVTSYGQLLMKEVPSIDPVTLLYVKEALQAFRSDCILSSSVMLGVATEHTFLLVLKAAFASARFSKNFTPVEKERSILPKVNKFKQVLEQIGPLPPEVKEDLDTYFAGILATIRTFRNDSGHPSGKIIDREQAYVLLNLFVPYCRKMYQLRDYFAS